MSETVETKEQFKVSADVVIVRDLSELRGAIPQPEAGDDESDHCIFNTRLPRAYAFGGAEEKQDENTSTYQRRVAFMRRPRPELDGLELMGYASYVRGLEEGGSGVLASKDDARPYAERLQDVVEQLCVAALEDFTNPTHVALLQDIGGCFETWGAFDAQGTKRLSSPHGECVLSYAPVYSAMVLTDKGRENLRQFMSPEAVEARTKQFVDSLKSLADDAADAKALAEQLKAEPPAGDDGGTEA